MKIRVIDLLNMKHDNLLKEGFKFIYDDTVYKLENKLFKAKNRQFLGIIYKMGGILDNKVIILTPELININEDIDNKNKRSVTQEDIDNILAKTYIKTEKYADKTTILKATLPNEFVIVASSSCVDPNNFDMSIGEQECMKQIEDKIWELEGYRLQCKISEE